MDSAIPQVRRRSRGVAPEVVAPSNRVNVALPFSTLRVQEASPELVEMASILAELTAVLDEASPGPGLDRVRRRAEALVARVG